MKAKRREGPSAFTEEKTQVFKNGDPIPGSKFFASHCVVCKANIRVADQYAAQQGIGLCDKCISIAPRCQLAESKKVPKPLSL